jgi:hypothetical protein
MTISVVDKLFCSSIALISCLCHALWGRVLAYPGSIPPRRLLSAPQRFRHPPVVEYKHDNVADSASFIGPQVLFFLFLYSYPFIHLSISNHENLVIRFGCIGRPFCCGRSRKIRLFQICSNSYRIPECPRNDRLCCCWSKGLGFSGRKSRRYVALRRLTLS